MMDGNSSKKLSFVTNFFSVNDNEMEIGNQRTLHVYLKGNRGHISAGLHAILSVPYPVHPLP